MADCFFWIVYLYTRQHRQLHFFVGLFWFLWSRVKKEESVTLELMWQTREASSMQALSWMVTRSGSVIGGSAPFGYRQTFLPISAPISLKNQTCTRTKIFSASFSCTSGPINVTLPIISLLHLRNIPWAFETRHSSNQRACSQVVEYILSTRGATYTRPRSPNHVRASGASQQTDQGVIFPLTGYPMSPGQAVRYEAPKLM